MINKIHDNLYTAESCLYKIYTTAPILIALYMKNFEEYTVPVAPIKVKNTIIDESDNFFVLPSIGSLVDGYLLIVSKKHINSMGGFYIMYKNPDNVCYLTNPFEPVSQMMRKIIAKDLDYENKFDWKKEMFVENINSTIKKFKERSD